MMEPHNQDELTIEEGHTMFNRALAHLSRPALLVGLLVCIMSTQVAAQTTATGFGQAHPNSPNVSLNSSWPVYVFHRAGVDYIQINDASGNVRAAFAHAGHQFLVLPAGVDSHRIATAQQQAAVPSSNSEVVYQDSQVVVTMVPQTGGTGWIATDVCGPECGNTKVKATSTAPTANVPASDATCGPECGNTKQ